MSAKINLLDERFSKLLQEVQSCFDKEEEQEVFFFDHDRPGHDHKIYTRTAVIKWEPDQFLLIQSHYWVNEESEPATIRIPTSVVNFMCADLLERSICASGFLIGPDSHKELKYKGWIDASGGS